MQLTRPVAHVQAPASVLLGTAPASSMWDVSVDNEDLADMEDAQNEQRRNDGDDARALMQRGADVERADASGYTPLHTID